MNFPHSPSALMVPFPQLQLLTYICTLDRGRGRGRERERETCTQHDEISITMFPGPTLERGEEPGRHCSHICTFEGVGEYS